MTQSGCTKRTTSKCPKRRRHVLALLLALSLAIAVLSLAGEEAFAAATSSDLILPKRAQEALEEFGLRELATPPLPPPFFKDEATSQALQAHILYVRATYLLLRSQWVHARQLLQEALRLSPGNYEIQLALAGLDGKTFKDTSALETCDRLIREFPNRIEAYELKGQILHKGGKVEDAIAAYMQAFRRWPGSDSLFRVLPRLALGQGDLDLTIEVCKGRLEREPRNFEALWWIGFVYSLKAENAKDPKLSSERDNYYRQSAKFYESALEARSSQTKLYPRLADVYLKLNERNKGVAALRRGLVADPQDKDIRKQFEQLVSPDRKGDELVAAYRSLAEEYPSSPDILDLYVSQLIAQEDFAEARRQLGRLLELEPNNVKTLLTLGGLDLQADDPDSAQKHFERAVQLAGDDSETYESIGQLYLRAQRHSDAIRFLERALARDPKRMAIYFALAQAYQEMKQLDKAADVIDRGLKAIEQAKNRRPLLLALGTLLQQKKQYADAAKALRQAYDLDRSDIIVFFRLANLLLTMDDKAAFDELLAGGRTTFRASRDAFEESLVSLLMDFHRYAEAVPELESLKQRHPERWPYYAQQAICYQRLRQSANGERLLDEARDRLGATSLDFNRFASRYYSVRYENQKACDVLLPLLDGTSVPLAREADGERFGLYESLFFNLGRLKQYDRIGKLLDRADREMGRLDPDQMKMLRARGLTEMRRFDEGIALYNELIQEDPKNARLYYELGAALNEAKRNNEAEKALRKCLDLLPETPKTSDESELRAAALNHIGYMFAETGTRLDEARKLLDQALELQPRAGFIVDSMGWLEFQEGHTAAALDLLRKAFDYSSEDPTVYDHLGDAYAKSGDKTKAVEFWREALRLDPSLTEVEAKIAKTSKKQ